MSNQAVEPDHGYLLALYHPVYLVELVVFSAQKLLLGLD
jgi:hypothetical protein